MSKILKKLLIITLTIAASFVVSRFVLAQGLDLGMSYGAAIGLGDQDPRVIAVNIIKIALSFLGIIAVSMIMYGGWLWMTSNGDDSKVDKAKKVLIGAVVGLIIILSSFAIVSFIAGKVSEVMGPGTPTATCDAGNVGACSGCRRCADLGGGNYSWVLDNTCPGCTAAAFVATAIQPPEAFCTAGFPDNTTIRNAVIRIYFNKNVDPDSVSSDSIVIKESNSQCPAGALSSIEGDFTINKRVVEFRPAAGTCPANPCNADRCFSSDSTIDVEIMTTGQDRVTANGGVEQVQDNLSLSEHIEFFTNDLIDCEDPSVVLDSSAQVCLDFINDLGAASSDDSGISQVEFSDDNSSFAFLGGTPTMIVPCPGPGVCGLAPADWILPVGSVQWQPTEVLGYSAGTDYVITVTADDLDDNESSDSRTFNLRPAHCCNLILDELEGEEGVDCGGPCAACAGIACGTSLNDDCGLTNADCHINDNICASGFCDCVDPGASGCQDAGYTLGVNDCCLCQNEPIIDWISPVGGFCDNDINKPCDKETEEADCGVGNICNIDTPNGAVGNFVTIGGRYFGASPGTVYFSDAAGDPIVAAVLANDPVQGNPSCGTDIDMWQDNQVIVVVPFGAGEGPVKIEVLSGYEDVTDDVGSGEPIINNFIVNNIERPGLCLAVPDSGYFTDPFNLQGIKFAGAVQEILFGNEQKNTIANNINFTSNISADAEIPNITEGGTTVFAQVDGIGSNFLQFEIFYDASIQPIIDYIDPPQGPVGQYITVYGSNFKEYEVGISFVQFDDGAGGWVYGDVSFPPECEDSWWHDSYIIVKVPSVPLGDREVKVSNSIGVSAPESFNVTIGEPGPGICLLDPHNGPVGQPVEAIGENFRDTDGKAQFYYEALGPIVSWDDNKVQTNVPSGAETGPFEIIDNSSNTSNSMPFAVGICTGDSDCFPSEECCAAGTYWSGICRKIGTCSDGAIALGGFGWMFTTAVSPVPPLICGGFSSAASCSAAGVCPNSPGECQTRTFNVTGECTDSHCNSMYSLYCGNDCVYDPAGNKCKAGGIVTQDFCDETNDLLILGYIAECQESNGQNVWQINTSGGSCPAGSFMDFNGWCTVGTLISPVLCQACDNGFYCQNNECFIGAEICASGSACVAGKCVLSNSICECCCRTLFSELDCCIGLTCEPGGCGDDPVNYGLCSGCRVELDYDLNTVTPIEQLMSDSACSCPGHSGKYCKITGTDSGVCVDKTPCDSNPYNNVCDPDQAICNADEYCDTATCFCEPKIDCDDDPNPGCQENDSICPINQYCDNIDCSCNYKYCNDAEFPICDPNNDLCDADAGETCDLDDCICIGGTGGAGTECINTLIPACDSGVSSCFASFDCIDNFGLDCRCCCDPLNDQCAAPLECYANQTPCDGPSRGLCCGCSSDIECSNGADGCGIDTCCHSRPEIVLNYPLDESDPLYNSDEICRNTAIIVNFDQEMDISSFTGNVIVVGDYGSKQCPPDTQFLTRDYLINKNKNLLSRAFSKILNIFRGAFNFIPKSSHLAKAYEPVDLTHNYCAITGNVTGYNDAADNGVLVFSPTQMLEANVRYYIIIKGDSNTADDEPKGVLSSFDVGMNGGSTEKFNSINYVNSYIWSFEASDKICELSYVKIDPSSYLFQSANETKDFYVYAKSSDGQDIAPMPNVYSWSWSWSSDNSSVAAVINSGNSQQTVTSQNVKDNSTYIRAEAAITSDIVTAISSVGQTKKGKAKVYVFLCENPWPPVPASGIWSPWIDDSTNCTIIDGGCEDTNYEFYYCRDTGQTGTSDDFPAILSDSTIIRGQSTLQDILKEAYFLREDVPTAEVDLNIANADVGTGARISAFWNAIPGVDGYKIYWGKSSDTYTDYKDVGLATTIFLGASDGLTNDQAYYFNLTAYYASGAESGYLDEVEFTPFDATAPAIPANLIGFAGDGEVELSWDENTDDAVSYNVYYGVAPGLYGSAEDVGDAVSAIVTGLTNGTIYYFVVTAVDSYGNESEYSNEEMAIPETP